MAEAPMGKRSSEIKGHKTGLPILVSWQWGDTGYLQEDYRHWGDDANRSWEMSKEEGSGFVILNTSFHIQWTVTIKEGRRQPKRQGLE